jgi:hypothetical protein
MLGLSCAAHDDRVGGDMTPPRSYEVVVSGRVGPAVADSLAPLTLDAQNGETTISGEGFDAAMLSGVLRTIERLGLELVAVRSSVDGERT